MCANAIDELPLNITDNDEELEKNAKKSESRMRRRLRVMQKANAKAKKGILLLFDSSPFSLSPTLLLLDFF